MPEVAVSRSVSVPAWLKVVIRSGLVLLAVGEFYNCVFVCDHDFLWHHDFGQAFLNDQVYAKTGQQHYLPGRAMIDASTAWLPYRLNRALWFLGTCAGLAYCTRFWSRVGGSPAKNWLGPASIALFVGITYINRDLAECGLQLFLLLLLTAAYASLIRGRSWLCGFWLGLAVAYKVMPIIFLPFLLWKRQWKAAGSMAAAMLSLSLLPAVFLGWEKNWTLHEQWLSKTVERLAIADPAENGVEAPVLWNRSLPLALARLVQEYPPGHPLYVESRGFVRFASLEPRAAKQFVQLALAGLAVTLAWRCRHAVGVRDQGAALAGEWAVVCILVALLSPLCWLHHLVLALPAGLLFAQSAAAGRAQRWQWGAAGVAVAMIMLVHRGLLGEALWTVVSVYHPHTLACLLLGTVVLASPRSKLVERRAIAGGFAPHRAAA